MSSLERHASNLEAKIDDVKSALAQEAAAERELTQKIGFQLRQLAFQQRVTGLTRSRIHGQAQSTAIQAHSRRQAVKSAAIMSTSAEHQQRSQRLQAALLDELDYRGRTATRRLVEMDQDLSRMERELSHKRVLLHSRQKAASSIEALCEEKQSTSECALARAAQARRREQQTKRRHFRALLSSANAVLDAEASQKENQRASVVPTPRHALDPDAAYEAACALQVPVELWPEFCLTVLIGGLRAAQPPETTEPPSKFA